MKHIIENYKRVVIEKFATVDGRATRSEFWYFVLANLIVMFVLSFIEEIIGGALQIQAILTSDESMLANVYSLIVLAPSIAVGIRRAHDSNRAWWHSIIPLYNIYVFVQKGTEGGNRFGQDPKGTAAAPIPAAASTPNEPTSQG